MKRKGSQRSYVRIVMDIINQPGQSVYLLQGDFLGLAGRSSLKGAR
jgi:hypothetical protein